MDRKIWISCLFAEHFLMAKWYFFSTNTEENDNPSANIRNASVYYEPMFYKWDKHNNLTIVYIILKYYSFFSIFTLTLVKSGCPVGIVSKMLCILSCVFVMGSCTYADLHLSVAIFFSSSSGSMTSIFSVQNWILVKPVLGGTFNYLSWRDSTESAIFGLVAFEGSTHQNYWYLWPVLTMETVLESHNTCDYLGHWVKVIWRSRSYETKWLVSYWS